MKTIRVILSYLRWHYTQGMADFFRNSVTVFWFLFHFFSIGLLLGSLFSPLKRLGMERGEHFDMKVFFSGLIVNTIMRIVGFLCRSCVIVFGLVVIVLAFGADVVIFAGWFLLPVMLVGFVAGGVNLLAA